VLGGKWKTVILCYLKQRPCRYSELRRLMPKVSDKVLTERLRDLTGSGLITRRGGASDKAVYVLTPRGRSLGALLTALYGWGIAQAPTFGVEVGQPLKMLDGSG
jgi:DNA-binding HxlR family transcriptional regulator